jgi:hypothetical protein
MSSVFKKLQKRERQNHDKLYLDEEERPQPLKKQQVEESEESDSEETPQEEASSTKSVEIDPEEELRAFKDAEPMSKDWKNR